MNDIRYIDADALLTDRMKSKYYHLPNGDIAIPIIDIEHAPTIEPEREKGEWVNDTNDGNFVTCSRCMVYSWRKDFVKTRGFNFCPNCGARLEGKE